MVAKAKHRKASAIHPVDAVVNDTVRKHGESAMTRKIQKEQLRLGPRRRIAKKLYDAAEGELSGRPHNGARPSHQRVAEMCEELAKTLAKQLGLESSAEKDE